MSSCSTAVRIPCLTTFFMYNFTAHMFMLLSEQVQFISSSFHITMLHLTSKIGCWLALLLCPHMLLGAVYRDKRVGWEQRPQVNANISITNSCSAHVRWQACLFERSLIRRCFEGRVGCSQFLHARKSRENSFNNYVATAKWTSWGSYV